VLWPKIGCVRPTCQAGRPCSLAGQPNFLLAPPLGIGYLEHRLCCTHRQNGFWKCANTCLAGRTHLNSVEPVLRDTSFPCIILSMTMPYFRHNEDMHGFWSIWCFSVIWCSWIDQQNSWNSLVISIYLLYLEWNVGMLVVNICILWPPTPPNIEFCSSLSKRKELNPRDIGKNSSVVTARESRTQLTTHTWALWMCLSLEPYDVERLEQRCHFTSRSVLVITWFTLPSIFSSFVTRSLILPVTLFPSANIFVVVHSQEVPMLHLVYCKKQRKILESLCGK
jgi:hypothetical protein